MINRLGTIAFFLAFGIPTFAQSFEGAISGGVSQISSGDLGSGYSLDSGFRLTFRMTINTREHLGYEFGYAYNRTHLGFPGFDAQGMATRATSTVTKLLEVPFFPVRLSLVALHFRGCNQGVPKRFPAS